MITTQEVDNKIHLFDESTKSVFPNVYVCMSGKQKTHIDWIVKQICDDANRICSMKAEKLMEYRAGALNSIERLIVNDFLCLHPEIITYVEKKLARRAKREQNKKLAQMKAQKKKAALKTRKENF